MYLEPLPPIEGPTVSNLAQKDDIIPIFFIPPLEDKPQDPIVERLKLQSYSPIEYQDMESDAEGSLDHDRQTHNQSGDVSPDKGYSRPSTPDLWDDCFNEDIQRCFAISWDEFGNPPMPPTTSPFFAEQPLHTFVAAQNVIERERTGSSTRRVQPRQLLTAIRMLLVGYSSPLFIFDPQKETFDLHPALKHNGVELIVDGYSALSTRSMLQRFCSIGTLIRRLDIYVLLVRSQGSLQTLHSLAHAIQQTTSYIKSEIESSLSDKTGKILDVWENQQQHEGLLEAIAAVCDRDLSQSPPYQVFSTNETEIVSLVYNHLLHHTTSSSPRNVRAMFVFILSRTSKHWQQLINESLGLSPLSGGRSITSHKHNNDTFEIGLKHTAPRLKFPGFVNKSAAQQISRGKRSLEILRKAKPSHPLCASPDLRTGAGLTKGWVWTEEEVENVVNRIEQYVHRMKRRIASWRKSSSRVKERPDTPSPIKGIPGKYSSVALNSEINEEGPLEELKYKPELVELAKFDLEPGTHFRNHLPTTAINDGSSHLPVSSEIEPDLHHTLAMFQEQLPISTPTLEHLTQVVVVEPLLSHCRLLSTSLLDLFLIDLHLLAHLDYLRRFVLMEDERFMANLRGALFDEWNATISSDLSNRPAEWGVGLSPTLSETGEWPPSQTRISFLLRRVIIDALDAGEQPTSRFNDVEEEELQVMQKEAEWRLGFFIKNQDDEEEEPAWMNSMGLEALDFLGIVYRPPQTLQIMMPTEIMEKYQRVFSFLLRLLRVETVTRSIFNLTFKTETASRLFSGNQDARSWFYSLRFWVQSFTSALTTYVSDIAIRANWGTFVSKLRRLDRESRARTNSASAVRYDDTDDDEDFDGVDVSDYELHQLNDVFSIISYHDATLDKILTACLLKSRHRSARGALDDVLELVFSFARLLRRLQAGMNEEKAANRIQELHTNWKKYMQVLIDSLRAMDEKGQARQSIFSAQYGDTFDIRDEEIGARTKYPGVGDLLIRLDPLANQYNSSAY